MIVLTRDCDIIRKRYNFGKLVATAGTFDLLHVGHIAHLTYCRRFGDYLIVLMSSDAKVKKKKGPNRPIISQCQRAKMLDALKVVDCVVIGFDPQPNHIGNRALLKIIRPQIFISKNPQWLRDKEILKKWGIELRVESDTESERLNSTTNIIETILKRYEKNRKL